MSEESAKKRVRVTLRDVARDVGVSIGTASVVINGSKGGTQISESTREAIRLSSHRLGYRPNRLARTLQKGATRSIGLVPSITGRNMMSGPHIQRVLNAAANELGDNNYDLLLITSWDHSLIDGLADVLLDGRIDGAILIAPHSDSHIISRFKEANFPFVILDHDPDLSINIFNANDDQGIRASVNHLRSLGHTRIAHIAGSQNVASGRRRLEAFLAATKDLETEVAVAYSDFTPGSGEVAMTEFLARNPRPTGVVCANDETAIGAIRIVRDAGLSVPGDISIIGFDDDAMGAYVRPALTTIGHPVEEIARAATEHLLKLIEGHPPIQNKQFNCELIIRDSAGCPKEDS